MHRKKFKKINNHFLWWEPRQTFIHKSTYTYNHLIHITDTFTYTHIHNLKFQVFSFIQECASLFMYKVVPKTSTQSLYCSNVLIKRFLTHFKFVVAGGGAGGCAVASKLLKHGKVAVIDPADVRFCIYVAKSKLLFEYHLI